MPTPGSVGTGAVLYRDWELPSFVRLAPELELRGAPSGVADQPAATADALELHVLKDEMRRFPTMDPGGRTLIGHWIDAMNCEHRAHRDETTRCGPFHSLAIERDLHSAPHDARLETR